MLCIIYINLAKYTNIFQYNLLVRDYSGKESSRSDMKRSTVKSSKRSGKVSMNARTSRSEEIIEQSELIKALAHPVRLSMMRLLSEARREDKQLCANDIEKHFDLSQPTISHHLKILREAKLVKTQQQGTWIYFSVYLPTVSVAYELIKSLCE